MGKDISDGHGHAITPIHEASSATRMTLRREQPDGQ